MAQLLQLTDISLTFGGDPILDKLNLILQPGDRLALVGRNGSGKSTLMKVMAGLVEPDVGQRSVAPAVHAGYMEQEPDFAGFATLGEFAASGLADDESWRVEAAAEGLKFDPERPCATASGGERRRAALARLMAQAPELLLLDEPTNHLDIEAITWLESQLAETRSAFVMISHDRAFLNTLTQGTLWLDRGELRRHYKGFQHFEAWRDKLWEEEDQARHKLNRKIKAEARWAVEGISARRKRNQGRVRALQALRAERAAQIKRQGVAAMALATGTKSGRKVVEARGISKSFGDHQISAPFDLTIQRGDRIALVGPNGVGKTTLLNILTGQAQPDQGSVKLGSNLEIAMFDQNRATLAPDQSLWDNLTLDPDMAVRGRSDQIMVRGAPRHVVGYLKDFLFEETQARAPVRSLSGGEKARLLLARLMAREANLLVMDEPTNDLDIETLDLLQELLDGFDGTVILVSHDRDFIDRVATTTIALEGDGRATVYAGGWSDYQAQRHGRTAELPKKTKAKPRKTAPKAKAAATTSEQLSFTEQHRLDALPAEIDRLVAEIAKLEEFLATPDLFTAEPVKFQKGSEALVERQEALHAAEEEWLMLAAKAEG